VPPFPPLRPKEFWLAASLLGGAVLVFLLPELSSPGALSVLPRVDPAGVLQVWAWNAFSSSEWLRGHFPLWNPHTALGQPHLANLQTAVFFPLWLLRALGTSPLAQDLVLALRLILAASLVFVLGKNAGEGFCGALAAGLLYALGGYGLWFLQLVDLNSQMLLPLLMLVWGKMFTLRRGYLMAASSLLSALVILGGHPEAIFNTFFLAWLYVIFLAARSRARLSAFLPLAAAGLIGMLLAGAALLPFANYLPRCWSLHAPGFGFFHLEARGILNLFWPGIHRIFADQPSGIPLQVLERGTLGLLFSGYRETAVPGVPPGLGLLPMLFVLLALGRLRRLNPAAAFFAAILALLLGLTFGLPGFRLIALLPVFNLASNFKFYFSEIHLAFAILAGFGLDQIVSSVRSRIAPDSRGAPDPRSAPDPRRVTWLSASLVALLLVNLYYHSRDVKPYLDLGTRNLKKAPYLNYLQQEQAVSGPFRITGLEGFFPPNLALAFGLDDLRSSDALFYRPYLELLNRLNGLEGDQAVRYFYPSYYTQPSPERLLRPLASLMGLRLAVGPRPLGHGEIMEQVLYHGSGLAGAGLPKKLVDPNLNPAQAVLFQHAPSRLDYPWPPAPGETRLGFSPWLDAKAAASDGAHLYLWTETRQTGNLLFTRFLAPRDLPASRFEVSLPDQAQDSQILHLATGPGPRNGRESDWCGWAELTADPPGTPEFFPRVELSDQKGRPVFVARNPNAFPRAFSVSRSLPTEPEPELFILSALSLEQLKEAATVPAGVAVKGFPGDHGRVQLLAYEPDRVELEVRRASQGLLVLADAAYPGWRAWVDGEESRIVRADYAFRGVVLARGKHAVQFRFEPLDFRIGLWVSLASLFFLLLVFFLGLKPRASSRTPHAAGLRPQASCLTPSSGDGHA